MTNERRPSGVSTGLVASAAVCWGLSGGIAGILLSNGWDPFVVSLHRGAVGLLFVLAWRVTSPRGRGFANPRLWLWSVVAGLGVAGNFALYFISIAEGGVAVAATLMYSAPVFVHLASFGLRRERPSARDVAATGLAMAGIVLLTRIHDVGPGSVTLLGVGAGLLAGLSYAVFIFGFKYAAPHGSPQEILVVAFTVLLAVLIWPSDADRAFAAVRSPDWPLFLALGVLGAGVSFVLYVVGLRDIAPTVASVVALVEPVTASLFGFVMLNERLTGMQILGMGLILVTATLSSVASKRTR